jgi:hypothetical protein
MLKNYDRAPKLSCFKIEKSTLQNNKNMRTKPIIKKKKIEMKGQRFFMTNNQLEFLKLYYYNYM